MTTTTITLLILKSDETEQKISIPSLSQYCMAVIKEKHFENLRTVFPSQPPQLEGLSRHSGLINKVKEGNSSTVIQLIYPPGESVTVFGDILGKGYYSIVCRGVFHSVDVAVKLYRRNITCRKGYTLWSHVEEEWRNSCRVSAVVGRSLKKRMAKVSFPVGWGMLDATVPFIIFNRCGKPLPVPYSPSLVMLVDHLHQHGICHGDLRANNVLTNENGVVLCDFGSVSNSVNSIEGDMRQLDKLWK